MNLKKYLLLIILLLSTVSIFAQVGINTENPNPSNINDVVLDINGRTIMRNLDLYKDYATLKAIDKVGIDTSGVLVRIPNIPIDVAYFQSPNSIKYSTDETTSFNNGNSTLISWNISTDQVFNDLLNYNDSESSFSFLEDGIFQVSGFLNFGMKMTSDYTFDASDYVGVNATIQYMKNNNQAAGWQDLSTCRSVFTGGYLTGGYYVSETMNIPPVLYSFSKGDKIRVITKKPIGVDVGGFEISKPTGSLYSKALNVVLP